MRATAKTSQALAAAPPPASDGVSAPPISIAWDETAASARLSVLRAHVSNTSSTQIEVAIELVGSGFDGRVVTRPYGARTVPARSSLALDIQPSELPIQTVSASSMFTIVARYTLPAQGSLSDALTAGRAELQRQVSAQPRRATFDADYRTVTLRTSAAQAEASAPRYDDDLDLSATPIGRVRDSQRGTMRDISELANEARRPGAEPLAVMGEPIDLPRDSISVTGPTEVLP